MTRKDLIKIIADRIKDKSIKKFHIEMIMETALEAFIDILAEAGRIENREFGVFAVKRTPERPGRNPITKETVMIAPRNFVQFRAGKKMKEMVASITMKYTLYSAQEFISFFLN